MSFALAGIIAPAAGAARLRDAIPLRGGYVIQIRSRACLLNGRPLDEEVREAAVAASAAGAVVYLESEHFGGTGAEAALGWRDGELILGPVREQSPGEGFEGFDEVERPDAVNNALRWLGVARGAHGSEFEALGLGDRRRWVRLEA